MKPKLILCLALVLGGVLFGCSSSPHSGDIHATSTSGSKPLIVFDNHPERGIALEIGQGQYSTRREILPEFVGDSIKTVRVRYFDKEVWADEKQVSEYLKGLFKEKSIELLEWQVWSQGFGRTDIECLIVFKEGDGDGEKEREGKLLLQDSVGYFRDANGKWWFLTSTTGEYFRGHHPHGRSAQKSQGK